MTDITGKAHGSVPAKTRAPAGALPRSDTGTVILHWSVVIAIVLAMLTGFRLSWDAPTAVFSRWIAPVLLQGDVWTIHFICACAVFASAAAYIVYLRRAALLSRNAMGRVRLLVLPAPARLKWQGFNTALHWAFYALALAMMATGVLLYLGFGGLVVDLHAALAIALVAYIAVHVLGHFMQGGLLRLIQIFLPAPLRHGPMVRAFPLGVALLVGGLSAAAIAALDLGTRTTLAIPRVATAPILDGRLDDAAWAASPLARIRTQQGANLAGGKGESRVEVRAVHDGETLYFAFRWQDPTRSLKRLPLVKRADGWHMLHNAADIADETAFYEDKFAVLFSRSDAFGNGGTTFMGDRPLKGMPGALNGRGLHYTADGTIADMWQWKASRGGHLGKMDDMHIGPPYPANAAQHAGTARYSAGYLQDPGKAFYLYNYKGEPPGGFRGPVTVLRLPKDPAAMTGKLGTVDLTAGASDPEGAQWWMFEDETVPYSPERDATIPVGTVMPSTLIIGRYEGDRDDVSAAPRWQEGWWTLEVKRKLRSTSKYDVDFTDPRPLYLWVSVFDHNQTRHTRHVRPLRLRLE